MENSGNNYSSLIWFNSHLFIINGNPLKFYLDGYSPTDFNDIVKIIEAYGGKLSKADAPDTFVFCEPSRPVGVRKYDLYDIEFFYDSIVALQPQKLIEYKLQVFTNPHMTSLIHEDESSRLKIKSENSNESQESMDHNLQAFTDEESSNFVDNDRSSNLEKKGETNHKPQKSMHHRPLLTTIQQQTSLLDDDKLVNSYYEEEDNGFYGQNRIDRSISRTKSQNELRDIRNSCTAAKEKVDRRLTECFVKIERLGEETIRVASTHDNNPDESPSENNGDACDNSQVDFGEMSRSSRRRSSTARVKNTRRNPNSIVPDGKNNEKKSLEGNLTHEKFVEFRKDKPKSRLKRLPWTEKEHRVMIKYLIDNDAIHRMRTTKVWIECFEQCKSLLHPSRTVEGLRTHNRNYLRHNYAKYIDDPEILKKFKEVGDSYGRKGARFTDHSYWSPEDNRALVQYLIEKDAIHKGGSQSFWTDNLNEIQPILSSTRTAHSLRMHFYSRLRHDYAKFTNDAEALRKFNESYCQNEHAKKGNMRQ